MRRTDPEAIDDLAESISGIGLFIQLPLRILVILLLLSGLYRLEAFKILKKKPFPQYR